MAILFCEQCGKETEWIYCGTSYSCKDCGWTLDEDDFRQYRRKILLEEFEKFLERERAAKVNPLEAFSTSSKP